MQNVPLRPGMCISTSADGRAAALYYKMGFTVPFFPINKVLQKLTGSNMFCAIISRSTKHYLVNIKTESWVAVEVTNSFL